jgi:2-polyprenyl-6-hydroxyphenyl methylase/3-demethylubiquinone-9 3-methyltransferase
VTAIDAGEAPLAVARLHLMESGLQVEYRMSTAERFSEKHAGGFDVVTCLELLEHVPEPASVVQACSTLVATGGDVFFATLNRNLKSFLFAIIGAEYVLRLVKRGTHSFRRFIKPSELEGWGSVNRLAPVDITGLHYNPFRKTYSLGGDTHVNYLMHFRKV